MKPATGKTDPAAALERMSIRLRPDGHSFRDGRLVEGEGHDTVCEVLTPKTVLVPQELFDPRQAGGYLNAAGTPCDDGEMPVWSDPEEGIVAVMALPRIEAESLGRPNGGRMRFTTPLLGKAPGGKPVVQLRIGQGAYCVKVWDGGLRLAEAFPLDGPDDPLFTVARLDGMFGFGRFDCLLYGDTSLRKPLKPYFRHVVCES